MYLQQMSNLLSSCKIRASKLQCILLAAYIRLNFFLEQKSKGNFMDKESSKKMLRYC